MKNKKYILYLALILSVSYSSYGQVQVQQGQSDSLRGTDSVELIPVPSADYSARNLHVMRLEATGIDSARFVITGLPGICEIEIYDESGFVHRQVTSEEESKMLLDLNELPAGPYFVRARPVANKRAIYAAYVIKPQ